MTETMDRAALHRSLEAMRFEVLPVKGALAQAELLEPGSTVTVTASAAKGIEPTLDTAARLTALGLHVVPHLAARSVGDRAHLRAITDRLAGLGVTEVFVVAGDANQPAGEFADSLSLLQAMDEVPNRPGRIGISGYPERHAFIPDASAIRSMSDKARYADYVVSQICFDPETISAWARDVQFRGVGLPIYVGAPGVVDARRLLRIALKIGLGESTRFLRKQYGTVSRMLTRYTPEELFDELAPQLIDPATGIAGWHLFTFNEIARTVQWRDELIARLAGRADQSA
ncbi:methylenetetrahydrofolate reductase [Saccharopolyspora halophila]|uniref:Methylenetetrahydrofolate reductase n=1 Tax=Saccharopolyspora halophila TaxID=405551 RepID=A0ABP5TAJ8_9PSEU